MTVHSGLQVGVIHRGRVIHSFLWNDLERRDLDTMERGPPPEVGVGGLVLVAAMVPAAGESAAQWWESTGQRRAMVELAEREGRQTGGLADPMDTLFHDVPPQLAAEALRRRQPLGQSAAPSGAP